MPRVPYHSVAVKEDDYLLIRAMAKTEGRTIAGLLRIIIADHMDVMYNDKEKGTLRRIAREIQREKRGAVQPYVSD